MPYRRNSDNVKIELKSSSIFICLVWYSSFSLICHIPERFPYLLFVLRVWQTLVVKQQNLVADDAEMNPLITVGQRVGREQDDHQPAAPVQVRNHDDTRLVRATAAATLAAVDHTFGELFPGFVVQCRVGLGCAGRVAAAAGRRLETCPRVAQRQRADFVHRRL